MTIKLLLLALLAAVAAAILFFFQAAALDRKVTTLEADLALATTFNEQCVGQVNTVAQQKAALVSKIAADTAAAEAAVDRYYRLEYEHGVLEKLTEKYREELVARDPDAAQWMLAGMPSGVACSVWPEAGACKD